MRRERRISRRGERRMKWRMRRIKRFPLSWLNVVLSVKNHIVKFDIVSRKKSLLDR